MISGTTSHKLDLISTYSGTQPFVIGFKGVTNITYNTDGSINQIFYTIGDINYITTYQISSTEGSSFPTSFYTFSTGSQEVTTSPSIKEEVKMGVVFPPKINNDLFIERMSLAVFERHSRLATINNIGALEEYRNGYYNIVKNN
jgi:hypothetical protein